MFPVNEDVCLKMKCLGRGVNQVVGTLQSGLVVGGKRQGVNLSRLITETRVVVRIRR